MTLRCSLCLVFLTSLSLQVASQANDSTARSSTTTHEGTFHGQNMGYTAIVKETLLPIEGGKAVASIITTSYISANSALSRPVLFLFNGGPGASSSPLHMEAFGPRQVSFDTKLGTFSLIDNKSCLLDGMDLVFIDPVGTGYTKVIDEEKARAYWEVRGDARAVLQVITNWLIDQGRTGSPIFLCGQSYGTIRATEILGLTENIRFSGLILFSAVLDYSAITDAPGNEIPYILQIPTMAAVAWYHHRSLPKKDLKTVYHEAELFTEKEYAQALLQGNKISKPEKEAVATRLAQLTGLPKQFVLEKNLRISSRDFQLNLLADQGNRVGQLDGKAVGPLKAPNRQPPYDDPSMQQRPSSKGAVGTYFTEELKFPGIGTYTTLNLNVNSKWDYNAVPERFGYWTVAPILVKKLIADPSLRVLVAGGYYDLATPSFATKYVMNHAGAPESQVQFFDFETGHSIFDVADQLEKLAAAVKAFVTAK